MLSFSIILSNPLIRLMRVIGLVSLVILIALINYLELCYILKIQNIDCR